MPEARWAIPVQVRQVAGEGAASDRMSSAQEVKVLLDGDEATVPLLDADAVVVVNSGAHGFYCVSYDDALRARVAGAAQRELVELQPRR